MDAGPANPYEAPKSAAAGSPAPRDASEFEQIRKQHLNHEAWIHAIGDLYCSAGAALLFALVVVMPAVADCIMSGRLLSTEDIVACLLLPILAVAGPLHIWVGIGLRRFRQNVRFPAAALAGVGLLGLPIGPVINAYVLYVLLSPQGGRILSPDYEQVLAATPAVWRRPSAVLVVFAILVLLHQLMLVIAVSDVVWMLPR